MFRLLLDQCPVFWVGSAGAEGRSAVFVGLGRTDGFKLMANWVGSLFAFFGFLLTIVIDDMILVGL